MMFEQVLRALPVETWFSFYHVFQFWCLCNFCFEFVLRGPTAVTRLTVYRWLQVMRPRKKVGLLDQNNLWQQRASNMMCFGSICQIFIRISGNTLEVSRNIVLEAHDIPRHGFGSRLMDRFWSGHEIWDFVSKHKENQGKIVRSTLLQVTRGRQIGSRGGPPVCAPGPHLNHDVSGPRSWNK